MQLLGVPCLLESLALQPSLLAVRPDVFLIVALVADWALLRTWAVLPEVPHLVAEEVSGCSVAVLPDICEFLAPEARESWSVVVDPHRQLRCE